MAISQLPQAPYRQDRKTFPTALSTDVLFSEIRDCTIVDFPEYGTPHPNTRKWPDHKLVFIKPVDIERNEIFEFFYAADRANQDRYNFAFGYRNIIGNAGGREFRNVQRMYVTARESFAPYDVPFGAPMPNVPEDKFEGVDYVFFDRQQQKIDQPELDSLYVLEVHTYVETAFLDDNLSYSSQRDDGLPEKFKIAIPQQQTETMVAGLAEMPVLTTGELSRSEDQLNPNVKLVKKLTRDLGTAPVLNSKVVTNVLQVANIEESIVDDGETIVASELTVDGSVESLGNGKSVKKVITAPELFTAPSFSTQRPDVTPEKFRVAIPTETTEESVAGTAEQPTLVAGEIAATEQQVNVFVKRKTKTKRNAASSTTLAQTATDNTKQLATVTETYQTGDTDEVPSATVDITSEALGDGTYVVRKVEVPEVFAAPSFATQRPDVTPEKFRVAIPTVTTEESVAGTAAQPTLVAGEIAATEQQVNVFVKRKTKTKRNAASSTTLAQKATDNTKQLATVTETYQTGDTTLTPSATVDITSEALGDGTYVVRKVEVPEVFAAPSFSTQRPDVTPEKFRVAIPTETTEESVAGTAAQPTLGVGDLAATEQQVNVFVKRKQKTKRNAASSTTLTQKATDNTKQLATVTETYQTGDTTLTPSATVDITSEALGDGTYVVRKVEVPTLFDAASYSTQKPDIVPERFRPQTPVTTTKKLKAGTAAAPTLAGDELVKSQQQVNRFVYEEQISGRATINDVVLPTANKAYVEGAIASVTEKLSTSPAIEQGLNISDSTSTAIGDGKFIVQTVKVDQWPTLLSSEWDHQLNTQVQRSEQFVAPSASFTEPNTAYRAVNEDRSLKVTEVEPADALSDYHLSFPVQVDVQLPNVLKSISVVWADEHADGAYDSEWYGNAGGVSYSLSGSENASADGSYTLKPELIYNIEQPWGSDVSATVHYFYLKSNNNSVSESAFLSRLSEFAAGAQRWPTFKPQSHTIVLQGAKVSVSARCNAAASSSVSPNGTMSDKTQGSGKSFDLGVQLSAVSLPPTIHPAIVITEAVAKSAVAKARCDVAWTGFNFPSVNVVSDINYQLNADVNPKTLEATVPSEIPLSGNYVLKSSIEPYKWGWVRCSAVVLDAATLHS